MWIYLTETRNEKPFAWKLTNCEFSLWKGNGKETKADTGRLFHYDDTNSYIIQQWRWIIISETIYNTQKNQDKLYKMVQSINKY